MQTSLSSQYSWLADAFFRNYPTSHVSARAMLGASGSEYKLSYSESCSESSRCGHSVCHSTKGDSVCGLVAELLLSHHRRDGGCKAVSAGSYNR